MRRSPRDSADGRRFARGSLVASASRARADEGRELICASRARVDQTIFYSHSNKPLHGATTLMSGGLSFLSTDDYFN